MVADFKNDLKGHTVNGRHIVFIVKKALTFPTWVWQAYWVMLQVKSIQRFKCSGVAILEPYFLEIPVQEKCRRPIRKETWQGRKIKLKKHWSV